MINETLVLLREQYDQFEQEKQRLIAEYSDQEQRIRIELEQTIRSDKLVLETLKKRSLVVIRIN